MGWLQPARPSRRSRRDETPGILFQTGTFLLLNLSQRAPRPGLSKWRVIEDGGWSHNCRAIRYEEALPGVDRPRTSAHLSSCRLSSGRGTPYPLQSCLVSTAGPWTRREVLCEWQQPPFGRLARGSLHFTPQGGTRSKSHCGTFFSSWMGILSVTWVSGKVS